MQLGSSRRFLRLGCLVFFTLLGANRSLGQQFSRYCQIVQNATEWQTSRNSIDPICQPTRNRDDKYQLRLPIRANVPPSSATQGIVIPGRLENQHNVIPSDDRDQNLDRQVTLSSNSPAQFQYIVVNSPAKIFRICTASRSRESLSSFASLNIACGPEELAQSAGRFGIAITVPNAMF